MNAERDWINNKTNNAMKTILTIYGMVCILKNHCLNERTRLARMEETSMSKNKSINQYSKLISIQHTETN